MGRNSEVRIQQQSEVEPGTDREVVERLSLKKRRGEDENIPPAALEQPTHTTANLVLLSSGCL